MARKRQDKNYINEARTGMKEQIKNRPVVFVVYIVLRAVVALALVLSALQGNFENVFMCVLVLVLFMLPNIVQKKFSIELPSALEIVVLVFIFAAIILGEISNYFVKFPMWDVLLHSTTGFICAAVGFSVVDLFNRSDRMGRRMSPFFLAITAFCFSMTIGVLWEFFEFGMDNIFHYDMQKDTIVNAIRSVILDETKTNTVVEISGITDTVVNGKSLGINGYLDIGLYDTMKDLFVNFIGAAVFSVIGYINARAGGNNKIANQFIPKVK